MIYDLTHRIEVATPQKATALREKASALLNGDDGCHVTTSHQAQALDRFRVVGVDTAQGTPFTEDVDAEDMQAAESKVVGRSKTKVVAEVRRV